MSQIAGLSQIESCLIDSSVSHIRLSFDQDMFSNYLEPNQNDVFDTQRFSLQPEKSNNASQKEQRSHTPGCCISKIVSNTSSARLLKNSSLKINASKSRPSSKLSKRVENLEKKEGMWNERANVWEKERKTYQKVLKVSKTHKNPTQYYKSQLEAWKTKNFVNKVSEDLMINPFQELRNVFEWICSQPDSTSFKSIKLSFMKIAQKLKEIEELVKEHQKNTKIQELIMQNEKLQGQVSEIKETLQEKSAELLKIETKMQTLQQKLIEKETEIYKLAEKLEENCFSDKIQTELEIKTYELLTISTENKRLACDLLQSNNSNDFYVKTIEELKQKLKKVKPEFGLKSGKENFITGKENFISETKKISESATQTGPRLRIPKKKSERKNLAYSDLLNFTSCMASALEAMIDSRPY